MMLKGDRGQALVELAFVIPLVLLFLFAIIDFGLALNQQNADTNLANVTARMVSVMGTTQPTCGGASKATLTLWVQCEAAATGAPTNVTVCAQDVAGSSPTESYTVGDPVEIEIKSTFKWTALVGVSNLNGLSSTIGGNATMRLEQPVGSNSTGANTDSWLGSLC